MVKNWNLRNEISFSRNNEDQISPTPKEWARKVHFPTRETDYNNLRKSEAACMIPYILVQNSHSENNIKILQVINNKKGTERNKIFCFNSLIFFDYKPRTPCAYIDKYNNKSYSNYNTKTRLNLFPKPSCQI